MGEGENCVGEVGEELGGAVRGTEREGSWRGAVARMCGGCVQRSCARGAMCESCVCVSCLGSCGVGLWPRCVGSSVHGEAVWGELCVWGGCCPAV